MTKKINAGQNKLLKIVVIFILVIVVIGFIRDGMIKASVGFVTKNILGTDSSIDSFSMGLLTQKVRIKGFKVYNPEGFPREIFVNLSEINVDYDLAALTKKKIHLPLMVVKLEEMIIIKNKEGKLNVDSLKFVSKDFAKKEEKKPEKPAEPIAMQIDKLTLKVGRVIYKDYSQGGREPVIKAFEGFEVNRENITSAQQLIAVVLLESTKKAAIQSAAVYGATAILGVGFLPAGVAGVLLSEDSMSEEFSKDYNSVYKVCLTKAAQKGQVVKEDRDTGLIKAKINGSDVNIKVERGDKRKVKVSVSARKLMMPQKDIAGGILYQITEQLK